MKFIAEIGSNFCTKDGKHLNRALELIEEAAYSGATHAKFQLFKAEYLYKDKAVQEKVRERELPQEWLPELAAKTREHKMQFLCTPFYPEAIDILDDYVNEWKVASWDITYTPLLEKIAKNSKPVILSTAAASFDEVDEAISILRPGDEFPDDVTVLHCHPGYPIKLKEFDLRRMTDMVAEFTYDMSGGGMLEYGLSSHYPDPIMNAAAVLHGATVIEAHFDLVDGLGVEAKHSLNPQQFKTMVEWSNKFRLALGKPTEGFTVSETWHRENDRRNPEDWLRPAKR